MKSITWSAVNFKKTRNLWDFYTWARDTVMWLADTLFWQLSIDYEMALPNQIAKL